MDKLDYKKYISKRAVDLPASGIRKFFDLVSEMPDAISLGVGEPDFITPWGIRDAAIKSIQKGYTRYTSNKGLPQLRENIAGYLKNRFSLSYDPDKEVMVTIGASEAIDLAIRAVCDPGDEVLIPAPSYVSYAPLVSIAGGVPVCIDMREEDEFRLTADALLKAVTKKTKALILPYPNNPTGAVMEKQHLLELTPLIKKHDLIVISDEIYAELTYEGQHTSIAALPGMRERTVHINGFSKSFAMTGWRVGFIAAPEELLVPMYKIHQYCIMCAPTASQYAALFALTQGAKEDYATIAEMRDEYDMRRRFLVKAFRDMGFSCFNPRGAFYVFPNVSHTGLSGEQFATRLLQKRGVAVIPGSAFGSSGDSFVRCCYATGMKDLHTAVERIERFIKEDI